MKSPVGNLKTLERTTIEEGLQAFRCPETEGLYIRAEDYWRWQRKLGPTPSNSPGDSDEVPVSEFDEIVKLCPESGTVMTRYRVGHGLPFKLDRSVTGGVWLDAGEWAALRSGGLHQNLHLVFTAPWQRAIRSDEHAARHEDRLKEKLGEEFFSRLGDLRTEIWAHPARALALAYLQPRPSPEDP